MKNKFLFLGGALTMALSGSFSLFSNSKNETYAITKEVIDYSNTSNTISLGGSLFLNKLLFNQSDCVISQAEANYLDKKFELKIDDVSNKNYKFGKLENIYWVEAFASTNYKPVCVCMPTVDGIEKYEFKQYSNQLLAQVDADSLDGAYIEYKSTKSIHPDDANKILVDAYNVGMQEALNIQTVNEYNSKLTDYNNYLVEKKNYEDYLVDKAKYDADLALYNKYLNEKAQYENDLIIYNQYIKDKAEFDDANEKYNLYISELDTYKKNYQNYLTALDIYNDNIEILNHLIDSLSIITTDYATGDNETIARFINSGTIEEVIANKDKISAVISSEPVDNCAAVTPLLRKFINEYAQMDKSDPQDVFNWYKKNSHNFKSFLIQLTESLDYLYRGSSVIRSQIEQKGKTRKFVLFLAELIYLVDELTNGQTISKYINQALDSKLDIGGEGHKGTYKEVLKGTLIDSSLPINLSVFPVKPEFNQVEPIKVDKPVEPTKVDKPVEPTIVDEPILPNVVNKPTVVDKPINPNIELNPELNDLANAFNHNQLFLRNKFTSYVDIDIEAKVNIELNKEQKVAAICDTTIGQDELSAKCQKIEFFNEIAEIGNGLSLQFSNVGIKCDDENLADEIIISLSNKCSEKTFCNLCNTSITNLMENQYNKANMKQYNAHFVHVIDNEKHENYKSLSTQFENIAYEDFVPEYDSQKITKHPDTYVSGVRKYTYQFVGFDYTVSKDETINGLSGLSNSKIIANSQGLEDEIFIYVVFKQIECFNVSWDGANVSNVLSGSVVSPIINPTKTDTNRIHYEFMGWKANGLSNVVTFPYIVTEDVNFVSDFKETPKYIITFIVDGNAFEPQFVIENEMPIIPTNPQKAADSNYFYEFAGWDNEVVPATKDSVYVATFNKKSIVEEAEIKNDSKTITINSSNKDNVVDLSNLLTLVKNNEYSLKPVVVNFESSLVFFTKEDINLFAASNVKTVELKRNESRMVKDDVELVIKKQDDSLLDGNYTFKVTISGLSNTSHIKAFENDSRISIVSSDNNSITLYMKNSKKVSLKSYFNLSFDKTQSNVRFKIDDVEVLASNTFEFESGTDVKIDAIVKEGYDYFGLYYFSDGVRQNVKDGNVKITNSDIVIYADTQKITYTINCYVDGTLIKTIFANYGQTVNLPTNVFKSASDKYEYQFVGWDKEIDVVKQNYDLHAVFEVKEIINQKEEKEVSTTTSTLKIAAICALTAVTVGFITTVIIVFVKRKPQKN